MRSGSLATAAAFCVLSASPSAHRLDEYLQAARVSLSHTGVMLEIDLVPGASVAENVIALVDGDGDGSISAREAESYGRAVLSDVVLELDDRPVAVTLNRVEVPTIDEMRHGLGTIQVRASGDVDLGMARQRQLHFRNDHHPRSSVYLVNALLPDEAGIAVASQTRDTTQRDARIDYLISPQWAKSLYWPVVGLVAVVLFLRRSAMTHH